VRCLCGGCWATGIPTATVRLVRSDLGFGSHVGDLSNENAGGAQQLIRRLKISEARRASRKFPGAPDFKGTPQECNAHYMKSLKPLWLSHAAYPRLNGVTQSETFISIQPERTCRNRSSAVFMS
jgi:hypothetical protein